MPLHSTLKRYFLILEKLRGDKKPTFKSIKNYLDDFDLNISHRTLQRDIEQIRNEFGIEISYNREKGFYVIDEAASYSLKAFMAFMEMNMTADLIRQSLKEQKLLLKHLQFEPVDFLRGHENLKTLIDAISQRRWVSFRHENFGTNTTRGYKVMPGFLRRYQNRWYLIAQNKTNHITFGIERISELKLLPEKFKDTDIRYPEKIDSVIGLNYSGGDVQKIVIQADAVQSKFLLSLPLHPSQTRIKETKDYSVFEYRLIPNLELMQAILRMGEQVKVLDPQSLVDEIRNSLRESLRQYQYFQSEF